MNIRCKIFIAFNIYALPLLFYSFFFSDRTSEKDIFRNSGEILNIYHHFSTKVFVERIFYDPSFLRTGTGGKRDRREIGEKIKVEFGISDLHSIYKYLPG